MHAIHVAQNMQCISMYGNLFRQCENKRCVSIISVGLFGWESSILWSNIKQVRYKGAFACKTEPSWSSYKRLHKILSTWPKIFWWPVARRSQSFWTKTPKPSSTFISLLLLKILLCVYMCAGGRESTTGNGQNCAHRLPKWFRRFAQWSFA